MRPQSVTDQIFIKANRIRSLEIKGTSMVDEGIRPEFIAIVNYGVIGLIQLGLISLYKYTINEREKPSITVIYFLCSHWNFLYPLHFAAGIFGPRRIMSYF